jgi:hypothetical protein
MKSMSQFSRISIRTLFSATLLSAVASPAILLAPAAAQAPAATSQLGTVKSIDGNTITITTKAGAPITVTLIPEAKVLTLAPGVTDIKQAEPGTPADITVGDRVLATGKPGDTADIILAQRVILMKATALAARDQADQADWRKRGVSGIVKSVNGDVVVISSQSKTINVQTTPATIVRRYADDSVKFQDAKPSTVSAIKVGDQLQARGAHSADNLAVTAEEIIDGSFANLSGIITAIDPTLGTISFKDLSTKKPVTIKLTANSEIKKIDPTMSARFLGGGAGGPGGGAPGGAPGGGAPGGGAPGGGAPGGYQRPTGAASGARRGADLSRMMAMLPPQTLSVLKPGDAIMVVATQPTGSNPYTAITLLGGVEQILAAKPENGEAITLQPWSIGEGGGGGMPGGGGL